MEEMNTSTTFLINLPTEITEEIVLYLTLPDRKNLRLTCKCLYELCNSDRLCRDEIIIWSEDLIHHMNTESDLFRLGRSHYDLALRENIIEKSSILPFFEKLGTRIRSIHFRNCSFRPGSLECIIMLCEGLTSLSLDSTLSNFSPDYSTFEPLLITRPQVTSLKVTLPPSKPYDYFHRMVSIFPNVTRLQIDAYLHQYFEISYFNMAPISSEEWLSVFDDIRKLGRNLESLQFSGLESQYLINKSEFFEAFPRLKQLTIDFNREKYTGTEKWYPCCSNLESVKLRGLSVSHPSEMMRLLTNTKLKSLSISANTLVFNVESFGKLVTSRLATIRFTTYKAISGLPMTILDSSLEVNNTVKYFYMSTEIQCPQSTEMLFPKYFRGLVYLSLSFATDSILQCIFEFQENLRSLNIFQCRGCSLNGFCGKYSKNNLQKLEHLTLRNVPLGIFKSDGLKRAFSFPRLKYLCLNLERNHQSGDPLQCTQIPIDLFEDSTELQALRLSDAALPSNEILSSLFRNRKKLKYLCYDMNHSNYRAVHSVTYLKKNCEYFSMTTEKFEHESRLGHAFYEKDLDRVIILNEALRQTFHSHETRTFEIDWIKA